VLHCVGATTLDEYRKYIEKDAALERRFQKILVGEASVEATIASLRGLLPAPAKARTINEMNQAIEEQASKI
jgi:ATP-dependent Clp protease ATP-binding subunit ClpA